MTDDLDTLRERDRRARSRDRPPAQRPGPARSRGRADQGLRRAGRSPDHDREREVLVRVAMANDGPLPQDALLSLYRQLIETIKRLEELEKSGNTG